MEGCTMKKILLGLLLLGVFCIQAYGACSISNIESGKTCSINSSNQLRITSPNTIVDKIKTNNQRTFSPRGSSTGAASPMPIENTGTNSNVRQYNSGCQFGMCPPNTKR